MSTACVLPAERRWRLPNAQPSEDRIFHPRYVAYAILGTTKSSMVVGCAQCKTEGSKSCFLIWSRSSCSTHDCGGHVSLYLAAAIHPSSHTIETAVTDGLALGRRRPLARQTCRPAGLASSTAGANWKASPLQRSVQKSQYITLPLAGEHRM